MTNSILSTWRKPVHPWDQEVGYIYTALYYLRKEMRVTVKVHGHEWQPILGGFSNPLDREIWVRIAPAKGRAASPRTLTISRQVVEAIGDLTFYGEGHVEEEDGFQFKVFDKCQRNPMDWISPEMEDEEDGGVSLL